MNAPLVQISVQPDRRTYLGSSDIAGLMGVSPWSTPLDVWLHKMGEQAEPITPEKEKLFKRGRRFEPRIVDDLIEDHSIIVTKRSTPEAPNRYLDREYPFLAAEIDFEWDDDGTIQNGEAKSVIGFARKKWGEADTDEVPIEYAAQCFFGLRVAVREKCLVAAGSGFDVTPYYLRRDDEIIDGMVQKAVSFWNNHVLARVPPDPVNMDDMMKLFARTKGRPVTLDDETAGLLADLRAVRSRIKADKAAEEDIAFRVADFVRRQWGHDDLSKIPADDARLLTAEGIELASWKAQSRPGIDTDKLRTKYPDIAAACTKTSNFRVLRIKK